MRRFSSAKKLSIFTALARERDDFFEARIAAERVPNRERSAQPFYSATDRDQLSIPWRYAESIAALVCNSLGNFVYAKDLLQNYILGFNDQLRCSFAQSKRVTHLLNLGCLLFETSSENFQFASAGAQQLLGNPPVAALP